MATYTNTVIPALGQLDQFFRVKAKKKIFSEFASSLQSNFDSATNQNTLDQTHQRLIREVYNNDYLDPQEQANLLQMTNTYKGLQEKKILDNQRRRSALTSTELLTDLTKDASFYSEGKLVSNNEIMSKIDDKLGPDADPEVKANLYKNFLELSRTEDKSSMRIDKDGIHIQRYKLAKDGSTIPMGEEFKASDSKDLTLQEKDAVNKYESGVFEDARKFDEYIKKQGILEAKSLRLKEASAQNTLDSYQKKLELKTHEERRKAYEKDLAGDDISILNPANPNETIYAKRKFVPAENKTGEENFNDYSSGKGTWKIVDLDGNEIKNAVKKVATEKQTVDEKNRIRLAVAQKLKSWGGEASSGVNTPLYNYLQDNYGEIENILDRNQDEMMSDTTPSQFLAKNLNDNVINDIVQKYNELRSSGENKPEDDKLINELEGILGQNLKQSTQPEKSKSLSDILRGK